MKKSKRVNHGRKADGKNIEMWLVYLFNFRRLEYRGLSIFECDLGPCILKNLRIFLNFKSGRSGVIGL